MTTENTRPQAAEDTTAAAKHPTPSQEEIRQRQRSMLNALLCCMI